MDSLVVEAVMSSVDLMIQRVGVGLHGRSGLQAVVSAITTRRHHRAKVSLSNAFFYFRLRNSKIYLIKIQGRSVQFVY